MPSHIQRLRTRDPERGAVTLVFAILVPLLIVVVGLAFDGRAKITAMQRADVAAAEAARAAGQHLSGADLTGNGTGVNRARAIAAARNYLETAGVAGTVDIRGAEIHVTTSTTGKTVLLSFIGITTFDATGEATVEIETGL